MTFVSFLLFLLFTGGLLFFGWQATRALLKISQIHLLVPIAFLSGISFYTICANALAYVVNVPNSAIITEIACYVIGAALYFWKRKTQVPLTDGISKKELTWVAATTAVFAVFFGFILLTNFSFDASVHRAYVSTLAHQNFPPRDPFAPSFSIQYHYGFDLFAASLVLATALPLAPAIEIALLLLIIPTFWMAYALIREVTGNHRAGMYSAWLLFFGGGFRYLAVLGHLDFHKTYLFDYIDQLYQEFVVKTQILGPGYFHAYSTDTFGVLLQHPPTTMAMPVVLLLLWLLYRESKTDTRAIWQYPFIIIVGTTLALTAEEKFVLVFGAWFVWRLFTFFRAKLSWKQNKAILLGPILSCVAVGLVVAFQGGIITDMVFNLFGWTKTTVVASISSVHAFALRAIPGVIATSGFYPFNKAYSWLFLVTEWGLPLFLLPFVIQSLRKRKDEFLWFLFAIITSSVLISFWLNYPAFPDVLYRFTAFGYMLLALPIGIMLAEFSTTYAKTTRSLLVLMAVSPLMFNLRALPVRPFIRLPEYDPTEVAIAKDIEHKIPPNAVVLTASPQDVTELWGRLAYVNGDKHWNLLDATFVTTLDSQTPDSLKSRGIQYIYVNPDFTNTLAGATFLRTYQKNLTPVYSHGSSYVLYKI